MKVIRFVGDIHSNSTQYHRLLIGCDASIQVGDMGAGFSSLKPGYPPGQEIAFPRTGKDWFIRGNHDNPKACYENEHYLGDYGFDRKIIPGTTLFFMGGAWSIDKPMRIPGVDWWPEEELSPEALEQAVKLYSEARPEIVVTHEAPLSACEHMFKDIPIFGGWGTTYGKETGALLTRTNQALQTMLDIHRPSLWVFGHYHWSRRFVLDGTNFSCLNELETMDFGE
jgi:Calcineurin-like phosphoesterase